MTKAEEQKMLRAVDKLKDNSGRIAKALERIAVALEPDVLLVSTESQGEALPEIGGVTAEEALAAIKTIRDYCKDTPADDCGTRCDLSIWCRTKKHFFPAHWGFEELDND